MRSISRRVGASGRLLYPKYRLLCAHHAEARGVGRRLSRAQEKRSSGPQRRLQRRQRRSRLRLVEVDQRVAADDQVDVTERGRLGHQVVPREPRQAPQLRARRPLGLGRGEDGAEVMPRKLGYVAEAIETWNERVGALARQLKSLWAQIGAEDRGVPRPKVGHRAGGDGRLEEK